jgi:hypothetical protein
MPMWNDPEITVTFSLVRRHLVPGGHLDAIGERSLLGRIAGQDRGLRAFRQRGRPWSPFQAVGRDRDVLVGGDRRQRQQPSASDPISIPMRVIALPPSLRIEALIDMTMNRFAPVSKGPASAAPRRPFASELHPRPPSHLIRIFLPFAASRLSA